ncbi:MAG: hypothetical protein R6X27_13755 [Candidatus Desulfacyla sp.]
MTPRSLQPPGLLLLLFCWIFLSTAPAAAADILKIETETTVEVAADRIRVTVAFANRGTAPAYNLQVHLNALGLADASPVAAQLDPGGSERVFFEREVKGVGKGRYPLTVRVDFHDANQYPFSALSGMTFHVGEAVNPDLAALTRDMTLDRSGRLRFDIKNLGPEPEKIIATLVLPKEFSSPEPKTAFEIGRRSERTVDFEIRNFSALPGAAYPVFCYFEYDSKGIHHTALARALITVRADQNLFRRFRWAWITLAGVLAALLILVLIRERRKKSRGA